MAKKRFQGVVTSDKMDKTIVVMINRTKVHPIYKKRYQVSKKYKVHDQKNEAKIGDQVTFEECRPLSKDKKWRLITILSEKASS
ncbi:30S ribosomal protein S17 [Patescibacteria group bacterium]|nr:30S ribosomal protein S17 [Patescibacteria group bacterium]